MKLAFKFLILLMALPNSFSYDNKITIPGVSHLCRSYGYWGRCISVHKCHRYQDYAEQYSMQYCLYGHGRPPYICCTFGNTIVFPDDGHDETITSSTTTTISTTTPRPKPPPKRRYNVEELHSIVIDLPSEIEDLIKQDKITNKTMEKQTKKQNDIQLFPKSGECGPLSIGHKVYGGVEAELGEFAWLVNLEYRTGEFSE
uniref:Clip domain-containing protein n=1 Tax=Stomoxys calcitrans TaxID=35570 RepID=A0A1I8PXG4_STOCA